jgi:ubiquinol-cytochrome c reductase cytochrome b subunit
MSPKLSPPKIGDVLARQGEDIDTRYHPSAAVRRQLNKVFPTHWSFLLGEIALYSFIVLLITGVYLTLFFDPSMTEVTYNGVYQPLRGVEMSRAYQSALDISFEVRGGLFVRQIHHWAALLFSASIMVHLARIFFTGAFRRPREANWVIGALLLILSMFEGYFGYSLPDDLLSGIGLRAALSSISLGMPVIGTWLHWALFGGDFPGNILIPRLYALHILLLPGIILALIGMHLAFVWFQKHTQFPGPGRTEHNVIGVRVMPVFAVKSGAFFAAIVGVLGLMGGLLQINPIWNLGPYKLAAGLLHDVDGGPGPYLAAVGVLLLASHHSRRGLGRGDHGSDIRPADDLPIPGKAVLRRPRAPQFAAAAAGCSGAHLDRRDGDRLLHGAHSRRDE